MTRPGLIRQYGHDELLPVERQVITDGDNKVYQEWWEPTAPTREEKVLACWRERKDAMRQGVTR